MDSLIYFLLKLLVCTTMSLFIVGLFVFAFSIHFVWGIASLAVMIMFIIIFIWSQEI